MIKKIKIKNFKGIDDLTINCAGKFNILIGENNIGKTTIFEAIHLWKMCYDQNIKKDKSGFYSKAHNIPFKGMEYIRVYNDMDLFPKGIDKKDATIEIIIWIDYENVEYKLGFLITKVSSIDDAYLHVEYTENSTFEAFEEKAKAKSKKLDTFLTINESRPVANIIVKEPYMYKAQVMDKVSKGKGYEVLRNQLRENTQVVQEHINNILGTNYKIIETESGKKQYITMNVDGKNILSYGSGFLQLAEIFSSIEYLDSEITILLIDEPDAHLHLKIQKKLIDEFRLLNNMQLFVITHNDRFLDEVENNEILFLDKNIKEKGELNPLVENAKTIVAENLGGCLEKIDILKYASKLVLVEGHGDLVFLDRLGEIYKRLKKINNNSIVFLKLEGIDTLNIKLRTYSRALKNIIPDTCDWIVIRDTDCIPSSKQDDARKFDLKAVDTANGSIIELFQNGYGIESTFVADKQRFARLLCIYYGLDNSEKDTVLTLIEEANEEFYNKVITIGSSVYLEWSKNFERQRNSRKDIFDKFKIEKEKILSEFTAENIQYIMTKPIFDFYLGTIDAKIKTLGGVNDNVPLDSKSIFNYYYDWIENIDDIFEPHKILLEEIYG